MQRFTASGPSSDGVEDEGQDEIKWDDADMRQLAANDSTDTVDGDSVREVAVTPARAASPAIAATTTGVEASAGVPVPSKQPQRQKRCVDNTVPTAFCERRAQRVRTAPVPWWDASSQLHRGELPVMHID